MQPDIKQERGLGAVAVTVGVLAFILICIAIWTLFVEAFSFGAQPGKAPVGTIQPVPVTETIDKGLLHAPLLGPVGQRYLRVEGAATDPDAGPQAIWRNYIFWWGVLLMLSAITLLISKRIVEPTNLETTVMHLKGDTNVSLRARGFRGG
jgi:hypothetical protein